MNLARFLFIKLLGIIFYSRVLIISAFRRINEIDRTCYAYLHLFTYHAIVKYLIETLCGTLTSVCVCVFVCCGYLCVQVCLFVARTFRTSQDLHGCVGHAGCHLKAGGGLTPYCSSAWVLLLPRISAVLFLGACIRRKLAAYLLLCNALLSYSSIKIGPTVL